MANALIQAFPPLAELINGAVEAMSRGAALTSLIGVVGVIWTVSQLYGALDVAFARIFAEAPERDMVRRTARGFLVVVLIGGAIVAFVVLVSLAGLIDAFLPGQMPGRQSRRSRSSGRSRSCRWSRRSSSWSPITSCRRTRRAGVPRWSRRSWSGS